jgi:ABC-type transport system substrate-binding protein
LGKRALFVFLTLASLLVVAAAEDAEDQTGLVVAVLENPPTLEPLGENGYMAMRIVYNAFDTLIAYGYPSFMMLPGLALEWERIGDKALVFKLQGG